MEEDRGVGGSAAPAQGGGEVKTEEELRLRCEDLQGRVTATKRKLAEEQHELAMAQMQYTEILREKGRMAREKRRIAQEQARMAQEEDERIRKALEDASRGDSQAGVAVIPQPEQWGRAISHEGDDSAEKSRGYGQDQGQGQGGSGSGSGSAACASFDNSESTGSSQAAVTEAAAAEAEAEAKGGSEKRGREEQGGTTETISEDPTGHTPAPAPTRKRTAPMATTATASAPERSTRSKAKSAPSRPDGDRVKHFLKSVEGWKYETKRQGWWLKKAPDALAYDLSNDNEIVTMIEADESLLAEFFLWEKEEMWTFLTEHCDVGVPRGSESKGWPCDGPFEASEAAIVCPDRTILADSGGVVSRDELPSFMTRPGASNVRDRFNNWQRNRECAPDYWI